MKIIDELIDELASSKPLTDVLIKAKVLAHKLKMSELSEWINHELNGYPDPKDIPDYRTLPCRVVGDVSNGFQRAKNWPLPLPDEFRDVMQTLRITQSISSLDDAAQGDNDMLVHQIPPEMYAYLSRSLASGFVVEYAKRETSKAHVLNIRTAVKSKLLDFLLKLSDETINDDKIQPQQMDDFKDLFKNTVFGDNTTILVGNHNSQQVQNKKMMKGNFKIVKEELLKHGVDESSINELEKILEKEKPDEKAKQPGAKVQSWMSKMFTKALDGSWTIGAAAAGKVLADAISSYYGW